MNYDKNENGNDVLSERHYILGGIQSFFRDRFHNEKGNVEMEGSNYSGLGPKGYHRSDEMILEEVSEVLTRSPSLDPSNIEVSVKDGVVTLHGTVPTLPMKKEAARIANDVFGAKEVINDVYIDAYGKPLVDNRTGMN